MEDEEDQIYDGTCRRKIRKEDKDSLARCLRSLYILCFFAILSSFLSCCCCYLVIVFCCVDARSVAYIEMEGSVY